MNDRIAYFGVPEGAPQVLSLSTSSDRVQLEVGASYELWASVDCFVLLGGSSVAALTTSTPLTAKLPKHIRISAADRKYLAGIVSTGTGSLFVTKLLIREVSATPNVV